VAGFGSIERAALKVLVRRLGVWRAIRVGLKVQRRELTGEPFSDLPPATSDDERGSRAQAGPAILLYRVLRSAVHEAEALSVCAEVVETCAVVFLRKSLGPLRRAELERLDEAGRARFVEERSRRFPNATLTWDEVSAERVRFTVTSCRLVQLVAEAGHPELAPLFCSGDARFFGSVEPDVELIRPHTIAQGAETCPFTLQWRSHSDPP
jgi:hypothetical protein